MSEIKIGVTVDCSGYEDGTAICAVGEVTSRADMKGAREVRGKWTDGANTHWARPDQITRHVPAAPVASRPKSCGDKLASEMTVREAMAMECFNGIIACPAITGDLAKLVNASLEYADALIAALDKERTK
jgi:hypothetical protein